VITVHRAEDLIPQASNTRYQKRFLNPDIEDYIIGKAKRARANERIVLKIEFLSTGPVDEAKVMIAIKKNFSNRKQESQTSLKQTLYHGRRSLIVALIFFAILFTLVEISKGLFPQNGLAKMLSESITILGWVALWRPAELLLYEWRPFKQNAKLFSRLEQSQIQIWYATAESHT